MPPPPLGVWDHQYLHLEAGTQLSNRLAFSFLVASLADTDRFEKVAPLQLLSCMFVEDGAWQGAACLSKNYEI